MDAEDFWWQCQRLADFPRNPRRDDVREFSLCAFKGKMRQRGESRVDATIRVNDRNVTASVRHTPRGSVWYSSGSIFYWKQPPSVDEEMLLILAFPPLEKDDWRARFPAGVGRPVPIHRSGGGTAAQYPPYPISGSGYDPVNFTYAAPAFDPSVYVLKKWL